MYYTSIIHQEWCERSYWMVRCINTRTDTGIATLYMVIECWFESQSLEYIYSHKYVQFEIISNWFVINMT